MRFQKACVETEYPNRIVVQEEFEEGPAVVAIERAVLMISCAKPR